MRTFTGVIISVQDGTPDLLVNSFYQDDLYDEMNATVHIEDVEWLWDIEGDELEDGIYSCLVDLIADNFGSNLCFHSFEKLVSFT